MEDHDLQQLAARLEKDSPLLRFPDELEQQYIRHHAETRLIVSNRVLFIGMTAYLLFTVLDYIAFPFNAAVTAWMIRALTAAVIVLLIFISRRLGDVRMTYVMVSASMIIVNASVVAIDVIGVNATGYDLPLGSLFVIIFSSTLIRFPFWISLGVIVVMMLTQVAGLALFTGLGISNVLRNVLFFSFIIIMLLFSNYSTDADSRRIFLLNMLRKKYDRSGLKESNAEEYAVMLNGFMRDKKPYLDPELRIEDVARALQIKRHHLTQIINEKYNKNFFMYVNEFRIRDAQKMMADEKYRDTTVLRIAYDTGFNSKATFNRMFKAVTGMTPTEYRKRFRHPKKTVSS
ncbi:MAG TPA: AraC family transcriptional regulator [Spirochaetota bacterium]|jgi:AraC-like DNA-binding protein|nr:AraC family transcriptional regulator [Spirochaetota bacterium]HPV40357.1 AraC family transcriptional regulator [Spirochaetota bacterium]